MFTGRPHAPDQAGSLSSDGLMLFVYSCHGGRTLD
jgi:hypothetical protein